MSDITQITWQLCRKGNNIAQMVLRHRVYFACHSTIATYVSLTNLYFRLHHQFHHFVICCYEGLSLCIRNYVTLIMCKYIMVCYLHFWFMTSLMICIFSLRYLSLTSLTINSICKSKIKSTVLYAAISYIPSLLVRLVFSGQLQI